MQIDGPGRKTTPAFSCAVTRDFDGGLLRRWTFDLTHRDALAVLRLRPERSGGAWSERAKVGLAVLCFFGGAMSGLLPWQGGLPFLATESDLLGMLSQVVISGCESGRSV